MQAFFLAAVMGRILGEYTKNNTICMVPVMVQHLYLHHNWNNALMIGYDS